MPRPQVIAHRGASSERPENTLAAFLRALERGAEAVELDVHATRDGVVVVHHDPVVRGESGEAIIAGVAASELSDLRVGGEPIPTLAEVLAAIGDRADVYVEIKGRAIEAMVVDVIRRAPAPHRCAVHSFDHAAVLRAHRLAPEIPGGVLLASSLVDPAHALRAADARDYWCEWSFIDKALVAAVHGAGGRVVAWTPRDPSEFAQLAGCGVDGICANDVLSLTTELRSQ